MTISPMIMIVLEIVILVTVVILGVIYVAVTQPALINQLEALANMADQSMSEDAMLAAVTPFLSNPAGDRSRHWVHCPAGAIDRRTAQTAGALVLCPSDRNTGAGICAGRAERRGICAL